MKRLMSWIMLGLLIFSIMGCSNKELSKDDQALVEQLMKDYQTYFDFPLDVNSFSAHIQKQESLVDQAKNEPIYDGDRVTLVRGGEPKDNEVLRVTGEYKDGELTGIFVEIHSEPTDYSEESLEQLAVAFLADHQLASEVSLVDQNMKENEREMIFRFKTEKDMVIKVYVNEDLKEVVGFLTTDGEDL